MSAATWHFFDAATGLFSGASFSGSRADLEKQLAHRGPGVGAFEGDVDHLSQRWGAGDELFDYKPQPPYDGTDLTLYVWWWDSSVKRWKLRPRLSKLKADAWEVARVARQAAIDAPLVTPFGTFDHHERARAAIATTAQASAENGKAVIYTAADNAEVELSAAQMMDVWMASHERVQDSRAKATALRAAIGAAKSPAALEAVTAPA